MFGLAAHAADAAVATVTAPSEAASEVALYRIPCRSFPALASSREMVSNEGKSDAGRLVAARGKIDAETAEAARRITSDCMVI